MTNSRRITGIWWMSDNPDIRVPGDLLMDEGRLELNGSFEGLKSGVWGVGRPGLTSPIQHKTILGVNRGGKIKYTLEYFDNPGWTDTWNNEYGYKADIYTLGRIFEGDHFDKTDNLKFKNYYVEYPNVFNWVSDGLITVTTFFKKSKKLKARDVSTRIDIRAPKEIVVYKGDEFKVLLSLYRGPMSFTPSDDMHLKQGCFVRLWSPKGIELSNAIDTYRHLQRFLSIAIGIDVEPIRFQMKTGRGKNGRMVTLIVKPKENTSKKSIRLNEMSFSFSDIKRNRQTIFEKWFTEKDKHSDMFDLFSSINSNTLKNINNQFRDIVSALEGYVSVETGKFEVSPDKAVKTLNEVLPKAKRIIDPKDYSRIRITRNKLAHVMIQAKDEINVMDYNDKYISANRMVFLLEYSLLKNLGVDDSILDKFYTNRKPYL